MRACSPSARARGRGGALLAGLRLERASGGGGTKRVVAAFYPLAFAAEQVGGSSVSVENLTPAGAEPHDLELTPGDVRDVQRAALVLYLGDGFMPALERALQERHGALGRPAAGRDGREPDGLAGDPHVWLDPCATRRWCARIGAALGEPQAAAAAGSDGSSGSTREFRRGPRPLRAAADRDEPRGVRLPRARDTASSRCRSRGWRPRRSRRRKDIERLVATRAQLGRDDRLRGDAPLAEARRDGRARGRAETAVLDPLEGLSDDAIAGGADYFTVMRANLAALRKALGCTS